MPYPVPCTGVAVISDSHTNLPLHTREVLTKQKTNKIGTHFQVPLTQNHISSHLQDLNADFGRSSVHVSNDEIVDELKDEAEVLREAKIGA